MPVFRRCILRLRRSHEFVAEDGGWGVWEPFDGSLVERGIISDVIYPDGTIPNG